MTSKLISIRAWALLALAAFLLRAIVPSGYMLGAAENADGRYLVVQLCTEHGGPPTVKAVNLDTGETIAVSDIGKRVPSKDKSANPQCVFAATSHLASPLTAAEPIRFAVAVAPEFASAADVLPGRGIAAPPPPARGPPSLI